MDTTEQEKEKLIEINDIYKVLIQDALGLTKDLVYSVRQWQLGSAFEFLLAVLVAWFMVLPNWNTNLILALYYVLLTGVFVLVGILGVRQYFKLRKKYAKLFEIQKELEEEQV